MTTGILLRSLRHSALERRLLSTGPAPGQRGPATTKKVPQREKRLRQFKNQTVIPLYEDIPTLRYSQSSRGKTEKLFSLDSQRVGTVSVGGTAIDWTVPEIAFAGRSNVGKSSLINALLKQPLARSSKTPGRTQQLHFFSIGGKPGAVPDICLVDMPGYGFAKAPKKYVDAWHELVGSYVSGSGMSTLKRVFVLIDVRRGLMTADIDFMQFMDQYGVAYQIVLTKGDFLTATRMQELVEQLKEANATALKALLPHVHITSASLNFGISHLRLNIMDAAGLIVPLVDADVELPSEQLWS